MSDTKGSLKARPLTAFERDIAEQMRTNPNLDTSRPCEGMDGPLPCSKPHGHTGPHYFWNPA